jgi:uncharacterized protein YodC (DUF2158 family)
VGVALEGVDTVKVGESLSPTGVRLMEQFQPGEVVRLKSGGPWMIITTVGTYSGWTMRVADTVACRWFEGEKPQETVFDVALLEKISARAYPRRDRTQLRVVPTRSH